MAISITSTERVFKYKQPNGSVVRLQDIDNSMKPMEIIDYHSQVFPELINAVIKVDNQGSEIIYEIDVKTGTKG